MLILRRLGSWLALALFWLLHWLPTPALGAIGSALGSFLYLFRRGRVADVNLALCFPDMPEGQRKMLGRRHFKSLGRNVIEMGVLWFGSDERALGLVSIRGREHIDRMCGKSAILLVPHFVGVDMAGARLAHDYPGSASIYSHQRNPVLNWLFLGGRKRFGDPILLSRQDGIRAIVKSLREGRLLYYLPDMDFGPRESIFVPFFGVPAATITALPRLARLGRAAVLPVVVRQLERGYEVTVYPPWEDYPSGNLEADLRRMNAFIEDRVREMPEQYFWAHKRFKTRPPGEPSPYRRQ